MGHSKDTEDAVIDDDTFFVRQYQKVVNKGKERNQMKRSKIRRDHASRVEALRHSINSVPQRPSAPKKSGDGNDPQAEHRSRLEALRTLLERKKDIERRIALSVEHLETAFNTTSKELQFGLNARTAAAASERAMVK